MRLLARLLLVLGLITVGSVAARAQCVNVTPPITGGGSVFGSNVSQWGAYFASKVDSNAGCANNLNLLGTVTYNSGAISALSPIANNSLLGNTTGGIAVARSILISALEANPTATAGPAAVNGSALTFMRSDAAPPVQLGTNAQKGIVQCDNSTITCTAGVISVLSAPASSIAVGTTTVSSGTSNGLLYNNPSGNVVGNLATANSGVLVTSGSGVPSISTTLPSGLAMGTPVSLNLTNATALPWPSTTGIPFLTALGTPHVSGSALTTTGNVGGTALTVASALDWVNGEGILVNHAGANFTASAPGACTVTAHGGTGTSYTYKMASFDAHGGVGAATTATTSGGATLSATVYNSISCTPGAGASGMAIWGGLTSGSQPFLVLVPAGTFNDLGAGYFNEPPPLPYWIPSVAPTSSLPDWLVTSIVSGAGTTNLVLANAATNSATGVDVIHDDTVALQAGINSAVAIHWGFFFNAGTYNISSPLTWCSGSCSAPLNISGSGMYTTTIALSSPTQDGIQTNSQAGGTIRDVGFLGGNAGAGGAPFQVAGSFINVLAVHPGSDTFVNLVSSSAFNFITTNSAPFVYANLVGDFSNIGVNFPTNIGDGTITGSYLNPETIPGAVNSLCIVNSTGDPGGLRFTNNKCLGAMSTAIVFAPTILDGDIYYSNNSLECLAGATSYAACTTGISFSYNGANFGNIGINGPGDIVGFNNGIASTSRAAWLSDIHVGAGIEIANTINGINAGGTTGLIVNGVMFQGVTTAIDVDSNSSGCVIGVNSYSAVTTNLTDASGTCGGTIPGNPTFSGNPSFTANPTFTGSGSQISLGANGGQGGNIKLNGSTSGNFQIAAASNGTPVMTSVQSSTAALAYMCYNTGTDAITYDSSGTCLVSSLRFKHDVSHLSDSLDAVMLWDPIRFIFNDQTTQKGWQEGISAESLAASDPLLVEYDDEGKPLKPRLMGMIARLVGAVQEEQHEIASLKREVGHRRHH